MGNTHKYKKYICFCFEGYYPSGGMSDLSDSFDEIGDAIKHVKKTEADFFQIIDRDTWETIKEG